LFNPWYHRLLFDIHILNIRYTQYDIFITFINIIRYFYFVVTDCYQLTHEVTHVFSKRYRFSIEKNGSFLYS